MSYRQIKRTWIGWKIIGIALFSISIISVPLGFHYYREYNEIVNLTDTQNVIQLQSNFTIVTTENQDLRNQIDDLESQLAWYQYQLDQLEKQFVLVRGKVEAGAHTKSITFKTSLASYTPNLDEERRFSIYLKNYETYEVHIEYEDYLWFIPLPNSCDPPNFRLETDATILDAGVFTCSGIVP